VDGAAGQDRADGVAVGEQDLLAREQVGGDQVHGDRGLFQASEAHVPAHQVLQPGTRAQGVAGTGHREHHLRSPQREDVVPAERRPGRGEQLQRPRGQAVRRHEDGVQGTGGRAHEQVRSNTPLGQCLEHADLHGAEAAAAGQHESGRHALLAPRGERFLPLAPRAAAATTWLTRGG
jgi:hypothetical protein